MLTNSLFVAYLHKCLKLKTNYMWGTFGQVITDTLIDTKTKQYPKRYSPERQATLRLRKGQYAFDCHGLIKSYIWGGYGNVRYNASQDITPSALLAQAKLKGKINTLPEKAGLCLFYPGHVGVYIGNGEVIESTLSSYGDGVVKTKLKGRGWIDWCQHPLIHDDTELQKAIQEKLKQATIKIEHPKAQDDEVKIIITREKKINPFRTFYKNLNGKEQNK